MPSTCVATTGRPWAIASMTARDAPASQREGATKTSAAERHCRGSAAPASVTLSGHACASSPISGPSPTTIRRAPGARACMSLHARKSTSTPLARCSRATVTASVASRPTPSARRARARSSDDGGRQRPVSTPLGITVHRARMPAASPAARSSSLTHTVSADQRVAKRSQRSAACFSRPSAA